MAILGNFSRSNFGAIRLNGGGAVALTRGNLSPSRPGEWRKWIYQDGATAMLATAAIPTGYYPQGAWRMPVIAGEMSVLGSGEGDLTAYLYPAMQMVVSIAGIGSLTADVSGRKEMMLTVTGTGAFAAAIAAYGNMDGTMAGVGDLDASIAGGVSIGIALTGQGDLDAAASLVIAMVLAATGSGSMSSGISGRLGMDLDATGTGTLSADINGRWDMLLAATGSGDLDAGIGALAYMVAELEGMGELEAFIGATANMSVDLTVTGSGLTLENVGGAVWSALSASNNVPATMGAALNAAGSAGDPWITPLPGSYPTGTAGAILSELPDAQAVRDAMALGTAETPAAGSIDKKMAQIKALVSATL